MVLLSIICSNSWCSLLGLATTTYNTHTHTQKTNSMDKGTTEHSRWTAWQRRLTFPPVRSASLPNSSSLQSVPSIDSTDTVTLTTGGQWGVSQALAAQTFIVWTLLIAPTLTVDPPFISCIFSQLLVEDGGRQESMSIIILHLQVPQVRVGLSICADNHLQDRQREQIRLVAFLTTVSTRKQAANLGPWLFGGCCNSQKGSRAESSRPPFG